MKTLLSASSHIRLSKLQNSFSRPGIEAAGPHSDDVHDWPSAAVTPSIDAPGAADVNTQTGDAGQPAALGLIGGETLDFADIDVPLTFDSQTDAVLADTVLALEPLDPSHLVSLPAKAQDAETPATPATQAGQPEQAVQPAQAPKLTAGRITRPKSAVTQWRNPKLSNRPAPTLDEVLGKMNLLQLLGYLARRTLGVIFPGLFSDEIPWTLRKETWNRIQEVQSVLKHNWQVERGVSQQPQAGEPIASIESLFAAPAVNTDLNLPEAPAEAPSEASAADTAAEAETDLPVTAETPGIAPAAETGITPGIEAVEIENAEAADAEQTPANAEPARPKLTLVVNNQPEPAGADDDAGFVVQDLQDEPDAAAHIVLLEEPTQPKPVQPEPPQPEPAAKRLADLPLRFSFDAAEPRLAYAAPQASGLSVSPPAGDPSDEASDPVYILESAPEPATATPEVIYAREGLPDEPSVSTPGLLNAEKILSAEKIAAILAGGNDQQPAQANPFAGAKPAALLAKPYASKPEPAARPADPKEAIRQVFHSALQQRQISEPLQASPGLPRLGWTHAETAPAVDVRDPHYNVISPVTRTPRQNDNLRQSDSALVLCSTGSGTIDVPVTLGEEVRQFTFQSMLFNNHILNKSLTSLTDRYFGNTPE